MISKSEPATALAAAPLFADLPSDIVSSLALELLRIELAPDELLWRQGEASGALHLVETGRLTVTASGPGEREIELAEVGPGDVLGELPLLAGGEHSASVRAVEFASVLALDRGRFRALLASLDPSAEALRRRLLNIVCERHRRAARTSLRDARRRPSARRRGRPRQ